MATGDAGRTTTIFDVGGNKYRIVAHVDYRRQTVKIEAVMDHKEYDKGLWKSGAADYLDALLVLVGKYEDENHFINEGMAPREALRALMEFNGLNQADIGGMTGSETAVSMFLKGDRGLSKSQVKKLAERFKIDAAVFMD